MSHRIDNTDPRNNVQGSLAVSQNSTTAGTQGAADFRMYETDKLAWIDHRAPATGVTTYTLTWPAAQAAAAGYVLTNDGSGQLSWAVGGGGGGGGSTSSITNQDTNNVASTVSVDTNDTVHINITTVDQVTVYPNYVDFFDQQGRLNLEIDMVNNYMRLLRGMQLTFQDPANNFAGFYQTGTIANTYQLQIPNALPSNVPGGVASMMSFLTNVYGTMQYGVADTIQNASASTTLNVNSSGDTNLVMNSGGTVSITGVNADPLFSVSSTLSNAYVIQNLTPGTLNGLFFVDTGVTASITFVGPFTNHNFRGMQLNGYGGSTFPVSTTVVNLTMQLFDASNMGTPLVTATNLDPIYQVQTLSGHYFNYILSTGYTLNDAVTYTFVINWTSIGYQQQVTIAGLQTSPPAGYSQSGFDVVLYNSVTVYSGVITSPTVSESTSVVAPLNLFTGSNNLACVIDPTSGVLTATQTGASTDQIIFGGDTFSFTDSNSNVVLQAQSLSNTSDNTVFQSNFDQFANVYDGAKWDIEYTVNSSFNTFDLYQPTSGKIGNTTTFDLHNAANGGGSIVTTFTATAVSTGPNDPDVVTYTFSPAVTIPGNTIYSLVTTANPGSIYGSMSGIPAGLSSSGPWPVNPFYPYFATRDKGLTSNVEMYQSATITNASGAITFLANGAQGTFTVVTPPSLPSSDDTAWIVNSTGNSKFSYTGRIQDSTAVTSVVASTAVVNASVGGSAAMQIYAPPSAADVPTDITTGQQNAPTSEQFYTGYAVLPLNTVQGRIDTLYLPLTQSGPNVQPASNVTFAIYEGVDNTGTLVWSETLTFTVPSGSLSSDPTMWPSANPSTPPVLLTDQQYTIAYTGDGSNVIQGNGGTPLTTGPLTMGDPNFVAGFFPYIYSQVMYDPNTIQSDGAIAINNPVTSRRTHIGTQATQAWSMYLPAAAAAGPGYSLVSQSSDVYTKLNWALPNVQRTTVTIASSDLGALDTTPVNLLPVPAGDTLYNIVSIVANYQYGTTPYTTGATLQIGYGPAQTEMITSAPATLITPASQSQVYTAGGPFGGAVDVVANFAGLAVTLTTATAFTGGDGSLVVTIYYSVVSGVV